MGVSGDLETGLKYIESLRTGMKSTSQLMKVVFDTHGGFIERWTRHQDGSETLTDKQVQFRLDPLRGDLVLTPGDIMLFMKTGTTNDKNKDIVNSKNKAISELKQLFDKVGDNGNFVFSACRIGDDENMGKALQQLSGGRINIYVTPDLVRESSNLQKIQELDLPRIADDKSVFSTIHFVHGFILFPAGFKDANKTEYKDPIKTDKNITLNSAGEPIQQTAPKDKITNDNGSN